MTEPIKLNLSLLGPFVTEERLEALQPKLAQVHASLLNKTCAGADFLGWLDLPWKMESELERIKSLAQEIRSRADHLVCIGIGGSYLGTRAAVEFLCDPFLGNSFLLYAGQNLSADAHASLIDYILDKQVYLNVISKSGTTTEPAIAFRLISQALAKKYSVDELKKRIITTTDKRRGVLRKLSDQQEYRSFVIEDDIGGRFSVLSPVGLLPIAAAGYDVEALLAGARDMATLCRASADVSKNPAAAYAAARYLLHQEGKKVEVLSFFEPSLFFLGEWWKQLFGESEGKDHTGLFPATANLTTDLHSLGQYLQEGERILFESFMTVSARRTLTIPHFEDDGDGLNFVAGKSLDEVNEQAYLGTRFAHAEGNLPNLTISLARRDEYTLGALFYFFEFAVAMSGLLLGVNPFDQPGVEAYKKNMFALLGKPGFEEQKKLLLSKFFGEA
ncbi:MAG: glucose-6-phosphate isomerase [candidate division KSB1 bacterium]|nr:glucose-6-phosphate isomerase [candidate division KSB1 bacterium]